MEHYADELAYSIPKGHKFCPKCSQIKIASIDNFHSSKNRGDGLAGWCKICRGTHNKVPPEKNRVTQRKHDASHKNEHALRGHIRRARKMNAVGTYTIKDIQRQYAAQKGKCYYCKVKVGTIYHVDHVIPLSRGGSNGPENLVIACPACNLSKKDKLPHEWPQGGRLL